VKKIREIARVETPPMNAPDPMRLILLPGLACDRRLFSAQRERFPQMVVPDWPSVAGSTPDARAFAQRCWDEWTVGEQPALPADRPYLLGGTSSGGIIAMEIAWLAQRLGKPPAAVLLISSCRSWQAVPRWYGRWSDWSAKLPKWIASNLFERRHVTHSPRAETAGAAAAQLIEAMYQSANWQDLQWFSRLMATWRREEADVASAPFPIHQLHGRLDSLLPKPSPQHATLLLDAGHWMCATHAATVNNWIEAIQRDALLKIRGPKPISK
jgi:pimeloyl-ACP methyl ester carboxylesterase